MTELTVRRREARGEAEGALVLLHGRGADENDLSALFDHLDPERRLLGLSPRGPLALPPGGAHWYVVERVGFPDHDTFLASLNGLSTWFDALPFPPERIVLGGFSQGAVMASALALGAGRPPPAGLAMLSGFLPQVEGFALDLDGRRSLPVAIGHGTLDPVIGVDFGRAAHEQLEQAGLDVLYRESPMPHTIDPAFLADLRGWLPL